MCLCKGADFKLDFFLLLCPSIDGLYAGPCPTPQAAAQEDPSRQSAGQTPQPGVRERGRQDRQVNGGGLLFRGCEAGTDDCPVQSGCGPEYSARVCLSGPKTEPLVLTTVTGQPNKEAMPWNGQTIKGFFCMIGLRLLEQQKQQIF